MTHYAIVDVRTGEVCHTGTNAATAASHLKPGTVHGSGPSRGAATARALEAADKAKQWYGTLYDGLQRISRRL